MKYCNNCGAQLADEAAFCTNCGKAFEQQPVAQQVYAQPTYDQQNYVQQPAQQNYVQQPMQQNYVQQPYAQPGYVQQPYAQPQPKVSGLATAAKILMIVSTVIMGFYIIPLAWCIPMTIAYNNMLKNNQPVSTGFKICTLLFVNTISGILMLCDNK